MQGDGLQTGTTQPRVSDTVLDSMVPGVGYSVRVGIVRFFPGCKVGILVETSALCRKHATVRVHAVLTTN